MCLRYLLLRRDDNSFGGGLCVGMCVCVCSKLQKQGNLEPSWAVKLQEIYNVNADLIYVLYSP
jgi:hypothetical protein